MVISQALSSDQKPHYLSNEEDGKGKLKDLVIIN